LRQGKVGAGLSITDSEVLLRIEEAVHGVFINVLES
jgi:hypothetical protein